MPDRQLREQNPDGRLMLLSCGAALHHARVALDAEGWSLHVDRAAGEPRVPQCAPREQEVKP